MNQKTDIKELLKKKDDPKVREKIVLKYLPVVKWVIRHLSPALPPAIDEEDLMSIGVMGLLEAIDKYDLNSKMKFKNYAAMVVKRVIIDELRKLDWVSRSLRKKVKEIEKKYAELEQKYKRPVTDEEVAKELGIDVEEIREAFMKVNAGIILSLESNPYPGDNQHELSELISSEDDEEEIIEKVSKEEVKKALLKAIDELPEREKLVITLYYYENLTRKEIGKIMGISEVRVFQLHTRALMRLRGKLSKFVEK